LFLKLAAATGLAAGATTSTTGCSSPSDEPESDEGELASSYEYIVVGSGAGGAHPEHGRDREAPLG
jgi:hypothetical protein